MKYTFIATLLISAASLNAFAGDPKSSPDVVGRDLSIRTLGAAGHVGIWTGSTVVEVLNHPYYVVQSNTLRDFKSRDVYWGARYGVGTANGSKVVLAGWNQRLYSPEYTLTSVWREGGVASKTCSKYSRGTCIKWVSSVSTAKFRCDTFVNFAFKKGNGDFLLKSGATLPRTVYNAMPKART